MSEIEMDEMFNRILWDNDKLLLLKANNASTFKEHRCYNKANPNIYELFSLSIVYYIPIRKQVSRGFYRRPTMTATYKPSTNIYYMTDMGCYDGGKKFASLDEMLDYTINKCEEFNLEKKEGRNEEIFMKYCFLPVILPFVVVPIAIVAFPFVFVFNYFRPRQRGF